MASFKKQVKGAYTNEDKAKRVIYLKGLADFEGIDLNPPEWLSDSAKEIYRQMLAADKIENLKQIDLPTLATFCKTYANIIDAAHHIDAEGLVVDGKTNPYERIFNSQTVQLKKLADALAFTPNARARLTMAQTRSGNTPEDKKDPFLKVLNNNG